MACTVSRGNETLVIFLPEPVEVTADNMFRAVENEIVGDQFTYMVLCRQKGRLDTTGIVKTVCQVLIA